jgi:hypothetical protein
MDQKARFHNLASLENSLMGNFIPMDVKVLTGLKESVKGIQPVFDAIVESFFRLLTISEKTY